LNSTAQKIIPSIESFVLKLLKKRNLGVKKIQRAVGAFYKIKFIYFSTIGIGKGHSTSGGRSAIAK